MVAVPAFHSRAAVRAAVAGRALVPRLHNPTAPLPRQAMLLLCQVPDSASCLFSCRSSGGEEAVEPASDLGVVSALAVSWDSSSSSELSSSSVECCSKISPRPVAIGSMVHHLVYWEESATPW